MEGAAEAEHRQREKAVSRAGTLDQPREEESLVMVGEAEEEEEEEGAEERVSWGSLNCPEHLDASVSRGGQAYISMALYGGGMGGGFSPIHVPPLTLGAKICWDKSLVTRRPPAEDISF